MFDTGVRIKRDIALFEDGEDTCWFRSVSSGLRVVEVQQATPGTKTCVATLPKLRNAMDLYRTLDYARA